MYLLYRRTCSLQMALWGQFMPKNLYHRTFTKLSDGMPLLTIYCRAQRPYPRLAIHIERAHADGVDISTVPMVNLRIVDITNHRAILL